MKHTSPITVILGPTASGKSDMALQLAAQTGAEIISADAYQIYKLMDIGTAKVSPDIRSKIPHHLIDICYPNDAFSVSDFYTLATRYAADLIQNNTPVILCGGTGLYLSSFIYNYEFSNHDTSSDYREQLELDLQKKGIDALTTQLTAIDSNASLHVDFKNPRRVIRALERFHKTNQRPSDLQQHQTQRSDIHIIGITQERQTLIERINERVDRMIHNGLIDEVEMLLQKGYSPELPSMKALGYREPILYLQGSLNKEEMIDLIKVKTRQFAKRQMTWFRKIEHIHWTYPS